jgi:glyoxylase-like metal-dependent hydrolase (beta-lactamase superfamily II)
MPAPIKSLFDRAPAPGDVVEIAPGLLWSRMPLTGEVPDHVNIFVLEERDRWTLVDTGKNSPECAAALERLRNGPLAGKPISRVLITHFHPDHIGQLGRLVGDGAVAWATRDTWLYARLTQMDHTATPSTEHLRFATAAGVRGMPLEAFRRRPPSTYGVEVHPIPNGFVRIDDGDELVIGGRRWRVYTGHGHAPSHATFWSDDGYAIVGDQILPGMSADLSVTVAEPEADPIREWYDSCRRFAGIASDDTICLAGHNHPFTGAPLRCEQLIATHESVLARLLLALQRPRTAVDCLETIYGRRLLPEEYGDRLGEAMGYLNHLHQTGRVERLLDRSGAYQWRVLKASSGAGARPALLGTLSPA